jgi:hypothetical protein
MDGLWMGIARGNMEDGRMGPKHSSRNVTCFSGICSKGSNCPSIETCVGLFAETWHVSMGGKFRGSCFKTHVLWCVIFDRRKQMPSHHQNTTCFHVGLFWGPRCPWVETHAKSPRSKQHICNLLLKWRWGPKSSPYFINAPYPGLLPRILTHSYWILLSKSD